MEKVCLVIGAGAGIGGTVAKKFASDGYHAYLARRTDEEGLNRLIKEIEDAGGKACLLYTSPSPRDLSTSRMPSSA